MRTVPATDCVYAFDAQMEPVCWVDSGEIFHVEMRDALDGQVTEDLQSMANVDQENVNPATGPIGVRGANPGGTLAVDVLDVRVAPRGYVTHGGRPRWFEQRRGLVRFSDLIQVPARPMIGTIGVAPLTGSSSNKLPGPHGGNMDVRDVCAGATIFLPIRQPGGMLALGDGHSVQADGESSGQGVETQAEATLRVRVIDTRLAEWPVIFLAGELMTVGAGHTLDEAAGLALDAMVGIMTGWTEFGVADAKVLLGLIGDVRVGQMVCPLRTARVALPVALIPWRRPLPL